MSHLRHACRRVAGIGIVALAIYPVTICAQTPPACARPLCVNRADDDAVAPSPGMLRYALQTARDGAVITFDPSLNGRVIELDPRSSTNHLKVLREIAISGPGSGLLTIDGG